MIQINCRGFISPMTGKRDVARDHTPTRMVPPTSKHQVKLCVGCQKRKEWLRYQVWLQEHGQPYRKEFGGDLYIYDKKKEDYDG